MIIQFSALVFEKKLLITQVLPKMIQIDVFGKEHQI